MRLPYLFLLSKNCFFAVCILIDNGFRHKRHTILGTGIRNYKKEYKKSIQHKKQRDFSARELIFNAQCSQNIELIPILLIFSSFHKQKSFTVCVTYYNPDNPSITFLNFSNMFSTGASPEADQSKVFVEEES